MSLPQSGTYPFGAVWNLSGIGEVGLAYGARR